MQHRKYTLIDTESWWDEELHKAYLRLDPECKHHRMACRKIGIAAALDLDIDGEGRISVGAVASWSEHVLGTEQAVVSALFDHLRARDDRTIVTWGGVPVDWQLLTLAAMADGQTLPPQALDAPRRNMPRANEDLALLLKGAGRTWHHASEVALRVGVPVSLLEGKVRVIKPVAEAAWLAVQDHCERDCLITAIVKIAWLTTRGTEGLRFEPAVIALVEGFLRRCPDHSLAKELRAYVCALRQNIRTKFEMAA
tara:strand:+ start:635 stop:1393 length:759 start_codon:yes stop_codon:yes gene_type:complete